MFKIISAMVVVSAIAVLSGCWLFMPPGGGHGGGPGGGGGQGGQQHEGGRGGGPGEGPGYAEPRR